MTSDCDFAQCRAFAEYAADAMEELTEEQRILVKRAFDVVEIFDAEEAWEDKLSGKKHISSPMPNNTEEYGKPPVKIDRPSKDSSFDDFFGTDNPKGNNLDQNKETPYKTSRQKKESSGDDFFGSDSPKGNSLGQNKGKSVPSNTNSQKKESSGDSFFDSDSSKLEKSKQKQHTKPSAKDDFFKS